MARSHTLSIPLFLAPLLALAACGSPQAPEAPPGAVEAATAELDRNDAIERRDTIKRIENEAEARTEDAERRIKAIERGKAGN
jgi:predicted small lipoprotein YifL